ncbi:MAG: LemA family protein [Planctomycetota bacterium]
MPAVVITCSLAAILLVVACRALHRKRLLENVPTSKVKGVFMGLNEVKGTALCADPLVSHLLETRCVHYRYSVEEHYRHTETYTDSKGKTQTRTRSGWEGIDSGESAVPFLLRDDTGSLRVDPHRAEIHADCVLRESCGPSHPLYYGKGPSSAISNSTHERRFVEHAIEIGARLYVMGMAQLREDVVAPEIAHHRSAELFLISTRKESQLTRKQGIVALLALLFGTAAAFLIPVFLAQSGDFQASLAANFAVAVAAGAGFFGVVALYYLVLVHNGLVSVRERAEMAESMIDVQLRRRHVLIPRLVACVQGYAHYEEETQRRLAEVRTQSAAGGTNERAEGQGRALRTIFALAEAYPELKADTNYLALQRELVDTEDRIALAREFFNESVTVYNNRLETLPDVAVAKVGRFRKVAYFAAKGFERTVPRV